ncbi:conserved hypothetical protein [Culex quinquefasciatus]|uniref:Uncharacterized protein n=1 Tax=Culex quinquefasciatus TaxID=7176 RepID=B0WU69_CULQU|nr:conserved hypothetical protein [Culex quinquefasciatus]|eukprot:XP_001857994.1 conserved hypothetical protein [Culex quinquefasciatus]
MDSCSVNLRSTGSPHGGHANLQLQQPMDGPFSVGSGRVPQQPPYNAAPDQHQVRGFLSAGSGHFGTKPSSIDLPGTAFQHSGAAASPSQLSSGEMMIHFSQLMEQLINQQLQFQHALSAMQSAMAAAPSSSIIQPVPEPQQQVEVMPSTRCDQGPFHLCQPSEPHSSFCSNLKIYGLFLDFRNAELVCLDVHRSYTHALPDKKLEPSIRKINQNAEKVKRKNCILKIRFAPNATALRVSNLGPFGTNELLYRVFDVFGPENPPAIASSGSRTGRALRPH